MAEFGMGDDEVGAALVAHVPAMAGILAAHRKDYGRVRPHELFSDALRFGFHERAHRRLEVLAQIVSFMGDLFEGTDERVRMLVADGFVSLVATWPAHPELDQFTATWSDGLREELERQRGAKRLVAENVWLESPNGVQRLAIVWVFNDAIEAIASDGEVVYIVGNEVRAVGAADGQTRWLYEGHDEEPLNASGGVTISKSTDGSLDVFAPFHYHVRLDANTGEELAWVMDPVETDVPDSGALPVFPPEDFDVSSSTGDRVRVGTSDGELLGTFNFTRPSFGDHPPMQIGSMLVLVLSSGHVMGLRRLSRQTDTRSEFLGD